MFEVGDIIRTTRTHRVVRRNGTEMTIADVRSDKHFGVDLAADHGTLKFEMVKKRPPKPKVGDRLTGAEILARWWKRGTVLKDRSGWVFVLDKDAFWHGSDGSSDLSFVEMAFMAEVGEPPWRYEIVYLPSS